MTYLRCGLVVEWVNSHKTGGGNSAGIASAGGGGQERSKDTLGPMFGRLRYLSLSSGGDHAHETRIAAAEILQVD